MNDFLQILIGDVDHPWKSGFHWQFHSVDLSIKAQHLNLTQHIAYRIKYFFFPRFILKFIFKCILREHTLYNLLLLLLYTIYGKKNCTKIFYKNKWCMKNLIKISISRRKESFCFKFFSMCVSTTSGNFFRWLIGL